VSSDKRLSALLDNHAELTTCAGSWTHVTRYRYHESMLSAIGAKHLNGRFHVQGTVPALYFAESPLTALLEVEALFGSSGEFVVNRSFPHVLVSVELVIPRGVLDLTAPENLALFQTSMQELTGSWFYDDAPATQRMGRIAYEKGRIVAIKYPSARWRGQFVQPNMVVFRDRLAATPGCKMVVYDPDGVPKSVEKST
jgi:RES domain-containing protein